MFRNFRRSYWLFSAFLGKHKGKIVISAILTMLGIIFLPSLAQKIPTGKPVYKIGRVGQPALTTLPEDIQNQVSSGLTAIAPDGTATPAAALSWQTFDDGQRFIFQLNPTLKWHDGSLLQAAHVIYDLEDVERNIIDSHTLEFRLKEPFAPFPTALSKPIFKKTTTISRLLKRQKSDLVGNGQFTIKRVVRKNQFIREIYLESLTEKRVYKFYPNETTAITAYKLGEVTSLEEIANSQSLEHWSNTSTVPTVHFDRYVAVFFNTQDSVLSDKNFRQALTYAIPDKPTGELRALGPINPNSWAYNPQVKPYTTDTDKAKDILAKINKENQDFNPIIRLDTSLAYLPTAEKIKLAWEALGVKTDVHVITYPPEDYQALLVAHQIPPDPDQYTLWHSTQKSTNITKLVNPKIDKLLEDGRRTLDQEERKNIYHDFQRFLLEESPAAFLFYQTTYTVSRK